MKKNQNQIVKAAIDLLKSSTEQYYTEPILMKEFDLVSVAQSKKIMLLISKAMKEEDQLDCDVLYSVCHSNDGKEYETDFVKTNDMLDVLKEAVSSRIKGISIFAIFHKSMQIQKLMKVSKSNFEDFSNISLQNAMMIAKAPTMQVQSKDKEISPSDMFKSKSPLKTVNKKQEPHKTNEKVPSKKLISDSQDDNEEEKQTIIKKKQQKINKKIQKKLLEDVDQTQSKQKKSKNLTKDTSIYTTNQNEAENFYDDNKKLTKSKKNIISDSDNTDSCINPKKPVKKQKKKKLLDSQQQNEVEKQQVQSEQSDTPKTKKVKMTQICKQTVTFKDQEGYLVTKQISKEKEYWAEVKVPTPTRVQPTRNNKKPASKGGGGTTRSLSSYFKKVQ